jgi:hypothetical protein
MTTILDRPEVLRALFHPRRDYSYPYSTTDVRLISIEVDPGVKIGGRLYPAESISPLIIFFHGNGEIASDYDDLAHFYNQIGITFLVWDYRGYGFSTGTPTAGNLLGDAVIVVEQIADICHANKLDPNRIYIMGRSLGSAAAIEAATRSPEGLSGMIIESGFSDTVSLLLRWGLPLQTTYDDINGFGNLTKIKEIRIPTLVIHGEVDTLIPLSDGRELYEACGAHQKKLVIIPGGRHNDLMSVGIKTYFDAVESFVCQDTID